MTKKEIIGNVNECVAKIRENSKKIRKVNVLEVKVFSSADYKDAKYAYDEFVKAVSTKIVDMDRITIAIYFDDDEDVYKLTRFNGFGEVYKTEFISWDEVSTFIYENM